MTMDYKKGLHFICDVNQCSVARLSDGLGYKAMISDLIKQHGLSMLGEVHHDFETGGFTSVQCLTESHISVHTWPEHALATFDVFLSNYEKYNNDIAEIIGENIIDFFQSKDPIIRRIER